jgi:hypothetical protein
VPNSRDCHAGARRMDGRFALLCFACCTATRASLSCFWVCSSRICRSTSSKMPECSAACRPYF